MTKTALRKPYTAVKKFHSISGERTRFTYEMEVNGRGVTELKVTGKEDIYEQIQGYKDEVTIDKILQRVAVGDMSDFRADGIYQDISEIPNNFIEARQSMQKLTNLWAKLKPEVKQKYNWNVEEFLAAAGQEAWLIDAGFKEAAPALETPIEEATKGVLDATPAEPSE